METQTKWTKRTQQFTSPNQLSCSQIRAGESKSRWQKYSETVQPIADDMAEKNRFERKPVVRQRQTEGARNLFGDKVIVDPKEKIGPTAGKRTAATEWNGHRAQRNATGMPMDAETQQLLDKMRNDANVSDNAAGRAQSAKVAVQAKPQASAEDIQAFCLFLAAAHPDAPLDERRGPNDGSPADERYRQAVITNATNLKRIWMTLRQRGICEYDLAGLLTSFEVAQRDNFLDYARPRTRGFERQLVNIAEEPQVDPQDAAAAAVQEVLGLVRSGKARIERMRPATSEETQEIIAARQMDFRTLAAEVRQGYKK